MVWNGLGGLIPDPQSDFRHLQTVKLVKYFQRFCPLADEGIGYIEFMENSRKERADGKVW